MSQLLINDYLKQLDVIRKVSGSQRETIVREAFKDLLKAWGRQHDLVFLAEYPVKTAAKTSIAVDGALLHELRLAVASSGCTAPSGSGTFRCRILRLR
ncbi:MAG: hypothetical protein Q7U52_06785 [Hydrogenophaga sp.]|uniref:hypothetical protein n=1 Tax=Hydrogenophaga sp. TaxID=1904254 RepID=UPI0027178AB0|nr:hypothetical protein [Hydrogenophaga sp.]MDO9147355.1 hypothetical protein [Hydrogenophaga sp.]MDO9606573.1 hypothetical protein [Hydrogenophaga sp.]MDP2163454.1 hypothetical protein [Hydrogenophaga sp.]MDP3537187.1 hypothetical protein [Azonexus sp.]